jgi:hypothetical protein
VRPPDNEPDSEVNERLERFHDEDLEDEIEDRPRPA